MGGILQGILFRDHACFGRRWVVAPVLQPFLPRIVSPVKADGRTAPSCGAVRASATPVPSALANVIDSSSWTLRASHSAVMDRIRGRVDRLHQLAMAIAREGGSLLIEERAAGRDGAQMSGTNDNSPAPCRRSPTPARPTGPRSGHCRSGRFRRLGRQFIPGRAIDSGPCARSFGGGRARRRARPATITSGSRSMRRSPSVWT